MMPTLAIAATHSTAPWYFAVPVVVLLGLRFWRIRGRGAGGPFRRGPSGGPGNDM